MLATKHLVPHDNDAQGPHDPELVDQPTALDTLIESQMSLLVQLDPLKTNCALSDDLAGMAAVLGTLPMRPTI